MHDDHANHAAPRRGDPRGELRAPARRLTEEHNRLLAGEAPDAAALRACREALESLATDLAAGFELTLRARILALKAHWIET